VGVRVVMGASGWVHGHGFRGCMDALGGWVRKYLDWYRGG